MAIPSKRAGADGRSTGGVGRITSCTFQPDAYDGRGKPYEAPPRALAAAEPAMHGIAPTGSRSWSAAWIAAATVLR